MTKYTAEDFARAELARHEDGILAARTDPEGTYPWNSGHVWASDAEMAASPGWSIVRDADAMTAREHLDSAWAKAHETDAIPAGAGYVTKWDNGDVEAVLEGSLHGKPSRGPVFKRRLLDPPAPARPEGAEELDEFVDRSIRGCSDITSPETVRAISDGLAESGVRVTGSES